MLRLSREADYGMLAMVYIASQPSGQLAYRRDIAAHYRIPREFLAKVLQKLSRRGLVRSFRGMQGGYQLARDAREITLADVITAVDGPLSLVDCQCLEYACGQEPVCTVKEIMSTVQHDILKVLEKITLDDMHRRLHPGQADRLIHVRGSAR
ncbi:MAG: RrF2 family transcriptional regulator [Candidatus Polarisedimenticolia bacterium]